jgi:DNA replication protein DnaC
MTDVEKVAALLRRHRLAPMADQLLLQEAGGDKRSCLARVSELVQTLDDARNARALARRTQDARLPIEGASITDVEATAGRNLSRSTLAPFQDGAWVGRKEHMVVVGKSGRGTTYLACALAQAALNAGHRVYYTEVPTLVSDWHAAADEKRTQELMRLIERADLLVLDDFGNTDEVLGREDLVALRRVLRLMLTKRSVLIVSKNAPEDLEEWLGGHEIADELADWLSHVPHRFELKGPSQRARALRPRSGRLHRGR